VTSSDLAKYSKTWNIARLLCDSWASCQFVHRSAVHLRH